MLNALLEGDQDFPLLELLEPLDMVGLSEKQLGTRSRYMQTALAGRPVYIMREKQHRALQAVQNDHKLFHFVPFQNAFECRELPDYAVR